MTKFFNHVTTYLIASCFCCAHLFADVVTQESLKTHLRWNLQAPRDQITIVKKDQTLQIETLNLQYFDTLSAELAKLNIDGQYISDLQYSKENYPAKPATVSVKLKDPSVELFSFYRDADKKYILDFWINSDLVTEKTAAFKKPLPLPVAPVARPVAVKKAPITPVIEPKTTVSSLSADPEYRDFRYGASFIWNYSPMIPQLEKDINLAAKVPDSLYPVKDHTKLDDPKEAHMQLTVNFYKSEKWGLLNKSITLYTKKYGRDSNFVTNEFMKANSLLKGNLSKPNRSITQSAMVMLANIKDMTEDYELKSAILRYLIQYNSDNRDYVKTLELSKQLFVEARAEFDQTVVIQAALTILHSLAELKQVEKIEEFLSDKKLTVILPPQMGLAYITFAQLAKGEGKDIIKRYNQVAKSLTKPVHPAILYNVAESYFREGDYAQAASVYEEFIGTYSYLLQAPAARLRLALAHEMMEKPSAQNIALYKNAIDRSTAPEIRYEAKLRYVAYNLARKVKPTEDDREKEIFLEQSPDEAKVLNADLKKLLWLVRLRLFINLKEYDKALAYLTSIPLDSLKPSERRVFEGDGAEIIYGMMNESYLKEDYAKVVKIWEVYKDKYETKVARNPYMNFAVCDAFIKLGLYKSFDRALATFKAVENEPPRLFPVWVDRVKNTNIDQMSQELALLRLVADKDWEGARIKLASLPVSLRDSLNYAYYQGLVNFHSKNYQDAVLEFEKVLVKQNPQNQLTPRQTADMLMSYVESLYQLKDQERFKTVVKALSEDINRSKSAQILNISERINYLLIEAYAGESKPEWTEIEGLAKSFKGKFVKSLYGPRIDYLFGVSLIKNLKVKDGKEVLQSLSADKTVPSHIKEMARSELATLELSHKKL